MEVSAAVAFDKEDAPNTPSPWKSATPPWRPSSPGEAELELSEGEVDLALSFDVTGALSDNLSYDFGVSTAIESMAASMTLTSLSASIWMRRLWSRTGTTPS